MNVGNLVLIVLLYAEWIGFSVCERIVDRWPEWKWKGVIKIVLDGFYAAFGGTIAWGFTRVMEFGVVVQIVCPLVVAVILAIRTLFLRNYCCLRKEDDEEKQVGDQNKPVSSVSAA